MLCSQNEIQTLAAKAARGIGLPWGVAEEAGRAARWLEARGLAGLSALDRALARLAASDWRQSFPIAEGRVWRGESGELDGLLAGMTLADAAHRLLPVAAGDALVLVGVRWPLLAVPFLAGVSRVSGKRLAVSPGPQMPAIGIGPQSADGSCRALEGMAFAETVRIASSGGGALLPDLPRLDGSIAVDGGVYARLDRRAARIYVPESAESQARGAGDGDLVAAD